MGQRQVRGLANVVDGNLGAALESGPGYRRAEDGEVFIFTRYNWWNDIVPIASVDRDNHTLTLAADCSYGGRKASKKCRL